VRFFLVIPGKAETSRSGVFAQSRRLLLFALVSLISIAASAQTLTGTVKNATTGKPAAGDEIVLLKLGQGMEEAGRTKADAKGKFTFSLGDNQSPHLVRVIHQEVTYHRMAPPGTTSVEVEVYDVAKKVDGISVVADIMRMQVEQGQLEVVRMFAVDNNSKPPRTQMNERNLEFYVPDGAKIIEAQSVTSGGQPLNSAPVPEDEKKTKYAFIFPLRPGTTQFQVGYEVPYTGSANLDPKSLYPTQHFVAILPKSMEFTAAPGAGFQSMNDPNQPDAIVQVASNTALGQNLAFKISGEGVLATRQEGENGQGESASPSAGNRPGGGLGPPIDAPDPLQKYRWYILGGFAAVLVIGGVFVARRQQTAQRVAIRLKAGVSAGQDDQEAVFTEADYQENDSQFADVPGGRRTRPLSSAPPRSPSLLLDGLKEELFQLEVDRKQGNISQQEYETAKAALDHTLERALKRAAQKA
jgi:hypothetical protein